MTSTFTRARAIGATLALTSLAVLGFAGISFAQAAPETGAQAPKDAAPPVVDEGAPLPELPALPAAIEELIHAQPFRLQTAYRTDYRKDQPLVEAGWILVVRADPALLAARQVAMPVLQVGDQVAERTNFGHQSGVAVLIVPSVIQPDGRLKLDLAKAPIFFGAPQLPEAMGDAEVADALASARAFAIDARPASELARARQRGGDLVTIADRDALLGEAARLVRRWSPDEADRVEGWGD